MISHSFVPLYHCGYEFHLYFFDYSAFCDRGYIIHDIRGAYYFVRYNIFYDFDYIYFYVKFLNSLLFLEFISIYLQQSRIRSLNYRF